MAADLSQVDPQWAWRPYEPTSQSPWTRRMAAHLSRRAGFAANDAQLNQAVKIGPTAAVEGLCRPGSTATDFEATSRDLAQQVLAAGSADQLAAWWLYRMLHTPDVLLEKLTLFWHGHFATSVAKVASSALMLQQNHVLRRGARGKFEELVRAIARDPAMLTYLDSTTNRRIHPNENFARELMELFTLGVGNYTETDIKQVARAFTGWEIRNQQFWFDRTQHDAGVKSFLGARGNFDGDEAIHIILAQPAAARFIARKLIRYFVFDEPSAPDSLVEPIAQEFSRQEFRVAPVISRILASNLFFSDHAVGRKVRSPVELVIGLLRALGATADLVKLAQGTSNLGQALFVPPNVKGWDGGREWINSSTLLGRPNLVGQIVNDPDTKYVASGGSLMAAARSAGANSSQAIVDWLLELLVAVPVPQAARAALLRLYDDSAAPSDPSRRIAIVIHAMSALPEFQLA